MSIQTVMTGEGENGVSGAFKVDVTRGSRDGRVSSQWFSRPADERFLSLDELYASVRGRADRSETSTVQSRDVRVEASRDDAEALSLILPNRAEPVAPTHWSFGQLASLVGAPGGYLRSLPAPLAGINLQYGLSNHRQELLKAYAAQDGRTELRAVTGLRLLGAIAIWLLAVASAAAAAQDRSGAVADLRHCDVAVREAAVENGVPVRLLLALAPIESGVRTRTGRIYPWPWTLSINGRGSCHFNSRAAAERHLDALIAAGIDNVDIGCLQVNWH